jgi:hypothetical protein
LTTTPAGESQRAFLFEVFRHMSNPFAPRIAVLDSLAQSPEGVLSVSFNLTKTDLFLFQAVHNLRMKSVHIVMTIAAALIAFDLGRAWALNAQVFEFFFVFFFVLFVMWLSQTVFVAALVFLSSNKRTVTHYKVAVSPKIFYFETPYGRYFGNGSAVQKLVAATNFVAIYVSDHSAVPIPKRAFQGPNSQAEFVAFVRAHAQPGA